jgi:hypothetical protein
MRGTDGHGVVTIEKTNTVANTDTYTVTCTRPDGTGDARTYEFTVTNGTAGIALVMAAGATKTKEADVPGFKFTNGTNPADADLGRQLFVYIGYENTASNPLLKINNTKALKLALNHVIVNKDLEAGLYAATLIKSGVDFV